MLGVRVSNMLVSGYGQGLSKKKKKKLFFIFLGLKGCRKRGGPDPLDPPLWIRP